MNYVPRPRAAATVCVLAALFGVSIGFNVFLGIKAYKPGLWRQIVLAIVRPPVPATDDHVRGPDTAPVTVIEYSDFQCPFCALIQPSLKKLAQAGQIKWIYRDFPLSGIHSRAMEAAEAAECAGSQGRFWEYADELFEHQRNLDVGTSSNYFFVDVANSIRLDQVRFQTCLSSRQFEARIRAQMAEGHSLRIEGTPTIFVNGYRQEGVLPLQQLEQLVISERK